VGACVGVGTLGAGGCARYSRNHQWLIEASTPGRPHFEELAMFFIGLAVGMIVGPIVIIIVVIFLIQDEQH